jgi:thiosulfate dehydrogenase (quinone) large subunit
MKDSTKILVTLRILIGWIFLYSGITKILNPDWSAAFYLKGAKTFTWFFDFLLSPEILPIVNFLNAWGLTLIGISLVLGLFTRLSAYLGVILMILYYLPVLDFPKVGDHAYLVDEHIIYATLLILIATTRAGNYFGLDTLLKKNIK